MNLLGISKNYYLLKRKNKIYSKEKNYVSNITFDKNGVEVNFPLFKDTHVGFDPYLGNNIINREFDMDCDSDENDVQEGKDLCKEDLDIDLKDVTKEDLNDIINYLEL